MIIVLIPGGAGVTLPIMVTLLLLPPTTFTRGFTGHEHLNAFNLIDMNDRVYDPVLCRFLSPDPYVQMPGFTQTHAPRDMQKLAKAGKGWCRFANLHLLAADL